VLPPGWFYVRVENDMPWTAVCTRDKVLVSLLEAIWNVTVCDTTESLQNIKYYSIPPYKIINPA